MTETRSYSPDGAITFRKTDEPFGGLSNMAPGFPLVVEGCALRTAEALYQACRFPHRPEVQRLIIGESSPMTAKMRSKPFREDSRPDWDEVRVPIMKWCLRVKLAQNPRKFGDLLRRTAHSDIVEDSRRDNFWGAIRDDDCRLHGRNVLGRLLMELRGKLFSDPTQLMLVKPVPIEMFEMLDCPIGDIVATEEIQPWYSVPDKLAHNDEVQVPLFR